MRIMRLAMIGLSATALVSQAAALTPLRSAAQQADDARQQAQASDIVRESVKRCFSTPPGTGGRAVTVTIQLHPDGSVAGRPEVAKHPSDPRTKALAAAAVRAVLRCAPYAMPEDLRAKPFLWTRQTIKFAPGN